MTSIRRVLQALCIPTFGLSVVCACGFDASLREYLNAHFWLPFAKNGVQFEKAGVQRSSAPFAGMRKADNATPLARLRAAYQEIAWPESSAYDTARLQQALAAARSAPNLTPREREELDLIDAKIDMRAGSRGHAEPLRKARGKLNGFLGKARTPEYLSEARGWLAHVHFLLGDQAAAGKIYLDELNQENSNLSRETLVNSLQLTYGYNGGPQLLKELDQYFDTPAHAVFAIQLATNPRTPRQLSRYGEEPEPAITAPLPYSQIKSLLEQHSALLRSEQGANALALLGMRTALRAGDPPAAVRIAARVPANAAIRSEPDFHWMLASAHFLSRDYAAAERPLLRLFRSSRSSDNQKAAAAYALCGVYQKTGNPVEQLRFALWLHSQAAPSFIDYGSGTKVEDQSVYWAVSGWDLGLLLDAEMPVESLRSFLSKYPRVPNARVVRYSLAVRLARENQYTEAAQIYSAVDARRRAARMRRLASLYRDASRPDVSGQEVQSAKYKMAEYISANPNRIYFNDELWSGLQRYALFAAKDGRLTRNERRRLMWVERKLKDDQEERWRAYLMLREVVQQSGRTDLGRRAAQLAVRCVRGISERFERSDELRAADLELSRWLRRS